jgi:hypothetical protein
MWQSGSWGFAALPWPVYRDAHGWDIGFRGAISAGVDRAQGAIATLFATAGLNWREERGFVIAEFSPLWRLGSGWLLTPRIQGFALPERTGAGVGLRAEHEAEESATTLVVNLRAVREDFKTLRSLSPAEWESGNNTWAGLSGEYRQSMGPLPGVTETSASIYAGGRFWGGDFAYNRVISSLTWSLDRVTLWATGGTAAGNLPPQLLFDLGDHGQMRAVPLWKIRSKDFTAAGFDVGAHVGHGLLAGAFSTTSHFSGTPTRQWEIGLSAFLCYDGNNPRLSEWLLRVDWPLYCSIAEATSSRETWDLRRFMIRIDFPIQGVEDPGIIRYRYPNR